MAKSGKQSLALQRVSHIHFVGIGGSGMSGIAEVLLTLGHTVSGSDQADNAVTQRLVTLGATIFKGHAAENIQGANVLVVSTAIDASNIEIASAQAQQTPVIRRAEMLAELMRFRQGIAVAGTHGKTTTTSLVASLLAEGGLDPTFVIGGRLNSAGSNARLGSSDYFVVEADESDASFLFLQPLISIITNIDEDHLATYENDFNRLRQAFIDFLHHLPFYGLAVLCVDDVHISEMLSEISRPILTYGFTEAAQVRALAVEQHGVQTHFSVQRPAPHKTLDITLNMPGNHNILNALAAITVATECGVSDQAIIDGLSSFSGVGRRFQIYGDFETTKGLVTLVDDYGHHPRELQVTLNAAKQAWPDRRVVVLFQPHRYSRTRDLWDEFIEVLAQVDHLLLLDIYPAGEMPLPGISVQALQQSIAEKSGKSVVLIDQDGQLNDVLAVELKDNDVLLTQGAGTVGQMAVQLAKNHLCFDTAVLEKQATR